MVHIQCAITRLRVIKARDKASEHCSLLLSELKTEIPYYDPQNMQTLLKTTEKTTTKRTLKKTKPKKAPKTTFSVRMTKHYLAHNTLPIGTCFELWK